MKKLIIAAALFISFSAFANEKEVSSRVLYAFQNEFTTATEVEWKASTDFYVASFSMNGQRVNAYYNTDGNLMGITRNITSAQLPVGLQNSMKKNYSTYWISNLFEVANNEGTSYYVTLENGSKKIVLQSSNGSDWSTYKKDRKI